MKFQRESFRKNVMKITDKIREEKLWYDNNTEAAKVSAISLGKIDKYEFINSIDKYHSTKEEW